MIFRTLSIAPMMACTDRHYRYLMRLITRHTLLYTVMVTTGALLYGDRDKHLMFNSEEHPVALQLGGSNPQELSECAKIAQDYGYDEVNLNIGCPSDRVQSGQFGACLMKQPQRVAECIAAMKEAVNLPITVKTRVGVDDYDSYEHLHNFVETLFKAGCDIFIFHARKAWLKGLSPAQNRHIPPLQPEVVYQIKRDFPHLTVIINGGIKTIEAVQEHLKWVDGVMLGREAYANPYLFSAVDSVFFEDFSAPSSQPAVVHQYLSYIEQELKKGVRLHALVRHLSGFFQGQAGARLWRRCLSET